MSTNGKFIVVLDLVDFHQVNLPTTRHVAIISIALWELFGSSNSATTEDDMNILLIL